MNQEEIADLVDADEDMSDSDEEQPSLRFTSQHVISGMPLTLVKTHMQHDELPNTYIVSHNVLTRGTNGAKIRVAQAESVLIEREEILEMGEEEWFFHMDAESHDTLYGPKSVGILIPRDTFRAGEISVGARRATLLPGARNFSARPAKLFGSCAKLLGGAKLFRPARNCTIYCSN